MGLFSKFKKLDAYGRPIGVNFDSKTTLQTAPGACITLLVYVATILVTALSIRAMIEYDRLTVTNFIVTNNDEEMIALNINMSEWNADVAVGFSNIAESRLQTIPPEIGQVRLMMTEMSAFTFDDVIRTPLGLELCGTENGVMQHPSIRDQERHILGQAYCVVGSDKDKMNLSGHANNLPFRALEIQVTTCVEANTDVTCASQEEINAFF